MSISFLFAIERNNTYTCGMKKETAIELLGGTPVKAAKAMGYRSPHAIYVWPDVLPQSISDRVMGARARLIMQGPAERAQAATETVAKLGA